MSVLSIKNLSVKAWGVTLLHQLNLQLEAGELLAVIGANGAGKTTLVNTIANAGHQHQETRGELMVCGQAFDQWLPQKKAKRLAVLPQLNNLNFPFTVDEVVQLGRMPHSTGKDIDDSIINEALKALDISHLKGRFYTQLSGGEKQRVQLARVMSQIWRGKDVSVEDKENDGKRLLLLDEPTSSLDIGHQQQLMKVIRQFADQGVSIIMIAHDVNLVVNHADTLLALSCGEVVAQGKPEEIVTPTLMKKLYQTDVEVISHPVTHKPIIVTS